MLLNVDVNEAMRSLFFFIFFFWRIGDAMAMMVATLVFNIRSSVLVTMMKISSSSLSSSVVVAIKTSQNFIVIKHHKEEIWKCERQIAQCRAIERGRWVTGRALLKVLLPL